MNINTAVNIFNSDFSNIAYIETQRRQILATIAYRILRNLNPLLKKQ